MGPCWYHENIFDIDIKIYHIQGESIYYKSDIVLSSQQVQWKLLAVSGLLVSLFSWKIVVCNLQTKFIVVLFAHPFVYYYMLFIIRRHILLSTLLFMTHNIWKHVKYKDICCIPVITSTIYLIIYFLETTANIYCRIISEYFRYGEINCVLS